MPQDLEKVKMLIKRDLTSQLSTNLIDQFNLDKEFLFEVFEESIKMDVGRELCQE